MGIFNFLKKKPVITQPSCVCDYSPISIESAFNVKDYVAFDVETTGLDPANDRIIEVAAVKYMDDQMINSFSALVNPRRLVDAEITRVTGITNKDLQGKPGFESLAKDLISFIGDLPIVAHNADFDAAFLANELVKAACSFNFKYIDTLEMSRSTFPKIKVHRLAYLIKALNLSDSKQTHRALDDAELCQKLFVCCKNEKTKDNKNNSRRYTHKAELDKAINTLVGIVHGIKADGVITQAEAYELAHWVSLHAELRNVSPFSSLLPVVENALADGNITQEECEDILWLCNKLTGSGEYYDDVSAFLQQLSGLIHGMLADNQLDDNEIQGLKIWLGENDFLTSSYPFDEIISRLDDILADGVITKKEREELVAFLSNFVDFKSSYNLSEKDYATLRAKYSTAGICKPCPDMELDGKLICFTGDSYKVSYEGLCEAAVSHGALIRQNVSGKTDYLVVGDAGNPAWAFACYGRKIEKAMQLQKEGKKVQVVSESDFWRAAEK